MRWYFTLVSANYDTTASTSLVYWHQQCYTIWNWGLGGLAQKGLKLKILFWNTSFHKIFPFLPSLKYGRASCLQCLTYVKFNDLATQTCSANYKYHLLEDWETLHFAMQCMYVSHYSQNTYQLFPYTALTALDCILSDVITGFIYIICINSRLQVVNDDAVSLVPWQQKS